MFEIGDMIVSGDGSDGDDSSGDDVLGELLGELLGDMDGDSSDGDNILAGDMEGLRNPFRRRKKNNRRKVLLAKALMAKKTGDGKLLKQLKPNKWRRQPLGFVSLAVPASGTVNVTGTPQNTFKGQRLTIPATVAQNFVVNSFFVGTMNQFVGSGAIPASTFVETAVGEDLNMDTAQIGNTIVLNVTNLDAGATHDFRATLIGDAVMNSTC